LKLSDIARNPESGERTDILRKAERNGELSDNILVKTLLQGGTVYDGSGRPGVVADVAIDGDRIADLGRIPPANFDRVVDCTGLAVTPGFIDAHVHGDLSLFVDPLHEPAIRQGVTTYIGGQDGVAFSPGGETVQRFMRRSTAGFNGNFATPGRSWSTIDDLLTQYDRTSAINVALLIPNGNVRMMVMGLDPRPATAREIAAMQAIVRDGMAQGAVGLSSGLDYIPSLYADEAELAALCEAIAPDGGIYVTHMRGYTPAKAPTAIAEVLAIGRRAGCGTHISHFNCLAGQAIPLIDGHDVTFDLYPYLFGSTTVAMLCLPVALWDGGLDATVARLHDPATRRLLHDEFAHPRFPLETIRLASCPHPDWRAYEGQRLVDAVAGGSMVDFVCDLLIATDLAAGCVIRHYAERLERDMIALMRHPAMMAGSDGIFVGSAPHPRGTGTFARYLGHHVRVGDWSMEDAVRKCTSAAAKRFGLKDRGEIGVGAYADVAVFDPATIADRSTFDAGRTLAVGMRHVFVNGEAVLADGKRTTATPGRGLRRNR
jgi:N-acyl-D-amino-acid deacylase